MKNHCHAGFRLLLMFGAVMLLPSCAYQFLDDPTPTGPHHTENVTPPYGAPMQKPLTFACDDGEKFVIAFSQSDDSALMRIPGVSMPEILKADPIGSGVEYANDDYDFREHQGHVVLTSLTAGDATHRCHKTSQG
jgi:hypothetical protein